MGIYEAFRRQTRGRWWGHAGALPEKEQRKVFTMSYSELGSGENYCTVLNDRCRSRQSRCPSDIARSALAVRGNVRVVHRHNLVLMARPIRLERAASLIFIVRSNW